MIKLAALFTLLSAVSDCGQPGTTPGTTPSTTPSTTLGKTIQLEKIIFHSTDCFGNCPTHHLELNKDKSFKLFAEKVYNKDAAPLSQDLDKSKMGYFTGQASDSSFNKLTHELNTIGLDTLSFAGPEYSDGPTITIIVYYDGKRKLFQSAFPSHRSRKLIETLYEICETKNMKGTDKKFEIENGKDTN